MKHSLRSSSGFSVCHLGVCLSVTLLDDGKRKEQQALTVRYLCRHRRDSAGPDAPPPRDAPASRRWAPSGGRSGDRDRDQDRERDAAPRGGSRW